MAAPSAAQPVSEMENPLTRVQLENAWLAHAHLQEQLANAQQALVQRGDPLAHAVLDAVDRWCDIAEETGHPAQMQAIELVRRWSGVQDRCRRVASGIVLPNGSSPSG